MSYKDSEEYKRKHAEWAKVAYHRNKEKHQERMRAYRQSEQGKQKRKEYVEKNKEKIALQEKITKKKYTEKHLNSVTDEYCIRKILEQTELNREQITQDMVDEKRIKILIKRLRNKIAEFKNDKK